MAKTLRRQIKSFSFAPDDQALLDAMQERLGVAGRLVNESETVRAGLYALLQMSERELQEILEKLPRLKPGRER